MEWLKTLSILLPILVVLSGAGIYVVNWYIEPNFNNGQYYTNVWVEYGIKQNTLNVEFVPDGKGAILPAMGEALSRLYVKATVNAKIDGKPVLVILWIRYKSDLVAMSQVLITGKEVEIIQKGSAAERRTMVERLGEKADLLYTKSQLMIERDGRIQYVNTTEFSWNTTETIQAAREAHMSEVDYA